MWPMQNKQQQTFPAYLEWVIFLHSAKKSTAQLRQLYFRMKDEIFGKARYGGMSFNTQGLERLLKEEFTETKCMDDESYPRYVT